MHKKQYLNDSVNNIHKSTREMFTLKCPYLLGNLSSFSSLHYVVDCEPTKDEGRIVFISSSEHLAQWKAHSKCLMHVCGMNRCKK